jgi:hypothetical protein
MGVALYIVAERETTGLDVGVSGRALGRSKDLDRLAGAAGVRRLMEFYSYDPQWMAEFIAAEGGELPEMGLPAEQWFPAEEGLATVRGLLGHLTANPQAVADQAAIIVDLREFDGVLARLASEGLRWHLAVDF